MTTDERPAPMTRAAVAEMSGRELDAAINFHLFGYSRTYDWPGASYPFADVTAYSTEEGPAFFAMLAAVRARDLYVEIVQSNRKDEWVVLLHPWGGESVAEARGDTLPLAFARAALMTTLGTEDET